MRNFTMEAFNLDSKADCKDYIWRKRFGTIW